METRSTILSELKEISPSVAEIGFGLPYQVPQGYFEGLAGLILQRIKTENLSAKEELATLSPLLSSLNKKLPYETPQGYFGELSENVMGGVKAIEFVNTELQGISPLMESLRRKNVYQVPQGYFDGLADNVLKRIRKQQPAKLVSMNAGRRLMRYAAAAVVIGIMAIAGWFYFNNDAGVKEQSIAATERISEDVKISDEEMASYLENETLPVAINAASNNNDEIDASDVKEMLSDVSDDELQQYLTTL